jgi:hypothetical protein
MILRVIEGGLGLSALPDATAKECDTPARDDVMREAQRRVIATGFETWRNREMLTGIPVPRDVSYRAMQIRFAAEAIGGLARIPADFRSDIYWPL